MNMDRDTGIRGRVETGNNCGICLPLRSLCTACLNRQLEYEEAQRVRQANNNLHLKQPEPEKLDVMSLEGQESF